ncbi:MAG: hypothetical protein QF535_22245 [Anaerolineales bacterium]|nr:hypothetical protein [Anaerolineales bacterium]
MLKIIGIIIAIFIIIVGGLYIYNDRNKENNDPVGDITSATMPDLDRELIFADSVDKEARVAIGINIDNYTELLKEDPTSYGNWLSLGLQRKIAGDYEAARDIWEYANILSPNNSISYHNLGDLYHFYLKDFPKSEENFKIAINHSPGAASYYINLHNLYKLSYKQDTTEAVNVLLIGIEVNPNNTDLLITLAVYYKDNDDNKNAKKYYQQARNKAQEFENDKLVELLNTEIENLQ